MGAESIGGTPVKLSPSQPVKLSDSVSLHAVRSLISIHAVDSEPESISAGVKILDAESALPRRTALNSISALCFTTQTKSSLGLPVNK